MSGGAHGGASRDAIIDDDRGAARDIRARSAVEVLPAPPLDFLELAVAGPLELEFGDALQSNDVLISHDDRPRAISQGSHRQLGMIRNADLAHQDQIKGRVERGSDLDGDRDPAAWQRLREVASAMLPLGFRAAPHTASRGSLRNIAC